MSREKAVRDTAYAIWESEGRPEGRAADHWRLAEERVAQGEATTGKPKASAPKGRGASKGQSKKASSEKPAPAKGKARKTM